MGDLGLARTELGDKQVCPNCGAKFYDLRRRPAVCPKCTTSFDPAEEGVRARRTRARVTSHDPAYDEDEEAEEKPRVVAGDDEDEEEVEVTPEVDSEAEAVPLVVDEDEDETPAAGDELPEGFSEDDPELETDAEDDEGVPLLEDEEEFPEDEIGDLSDENEDDESR
jgi:uncharacterized protein (TIGR02300 family)